jgi:DNA primase
MLLMQPTLATASDLSWVDGEADEDILLRQTIETCLLHPHSKPAVLMRELEGKVEAKGLRELERELSLLDETLDLERELAGTRQQLQDVYSHKQSSNLLARVGEKPLSALTEEEKVLLKSVGNKPSQNRA